MVPCLPADCCLKDGDIGLASRSAARQPQNVALPVRIQHLEAVIKAAAKKGAFDRARQGVSVRQ
jgi:hypothetical protein